MLKANWIDCNRPKSDPHRSYAEMMVARRVTELLGKNLVKAFNEYKSQLRHPNCAFELAELQAKIQTFDDCFTRDGHWLRSETRNPCLVWEMKNDLL